MPIRRYYFSKGECGSGSNEANVYFIIKYKNEQKMQEIAGGEGIT